MSKNETYDEFVNKFKPKLTTDDCYTPPKIYEVILEWVKKYYGVNERIIRPFNPNDDYKKYDYSNAVVVDNPPFSILSKIIDYYLDNDIKFFLFAPGLMCFNYLCKNRKVCILPINVTITYENGARVNTGFITNLENNPDLMNYYKVEALQHSIFQLSTNSKFKALSADANVLDGLNIHFAVIDELHEYDREKFKNILDNLNE